MENGPAGYTDIAGQAAFDKFNSLLRKVQRDSPYRAVGPALTIAKREYQQYLQELQPIGQQMLTRAIETLDAIKSRLEPPPSYEIRASDYRNRHFAQFIAGQFQLNDDGSLYIRPTVPDTALGFAVRIEVRLFTKKLYAFIPVDVFDGSDWRRGELFDAATRTTSSDASFVYADSYEELMEKVVARVQAKLDTMPTPGSRIPPCRVESAEGMRAWFDALHSIGLGFHPDDSPETVVNAGGRVFTDAECVQLRAILPALFAKHGEAVYEVAVAAAGISDEDDEGHDRPRP